eukprot:TRINITY_DN3007_c0_g1_i1.p2 TRINITY_DN3007_c0_g1~~TRINITY_DN3007_c0_g1_i1.p2  ORF type:complete len:227 (+),score=22.85 TRINITY_DN3007_c0_g1_i1:88-768(+)
MTEVANSVPSLTIHTSESAMNEFVKAAESVIAKALDQFSLAELGVAMNGGKDCCVVVALLQRYLKEDFKKLVFFYFPDEDPFPELEEFITSECGLLGVPLHRTSTSDYKQGLWEIHNKTKIKAVFMGTRSSDPYAGKDEFAPCTAGWPPLVRVFPILHWEYNHVWSYIRKHDVNVCSLYKEGYSSLGSKSLTEKNPLLRLPDGGYRPAWELDDAETERTGRSPSRH